jgi:endonuclease YncB( thermonuclease family)
VALHRRRRIFRGGLSSQGRAGGGIGRTIMAGLLGITVLGAALLLVLPAQLLGRVPAMTGKVQAPAAAVAVVDGQTLRVGEAVVRLQGVEAPARGTLCLMPDQRRFDCGAAAAAALARVVRSHPVACRLYGTDAAGVAQGLCEAGPVEINRAMVAAGWARAAAGAEGFAEARFTDEESDARAAHRGIWQGGPASF